MTRARRSLALLTLLGLVSCNADTGTVLYVTLRPRLATHTPATIHIAVSNAGATAIRDFTLGAGQRLPLSFTVTPTGRTGTLHIDASATFPDGQSAGHGSLDVAIVPDKEVDADLVIEPDDFVVNKATPGAQAMVFDVPRSGRQLAVAPDGGFLVAFENDCGSLGRCDVLGRLFDKTATPAKNQTSLDDGDLILNQAPVYSETPAIGAGKSGYLAAWVTKADEGSVGDIRATVLGFDGGHDGADFDVSTAAEEELGPTVFALTDGSFVVTWERTRASGTTREIRARLYSADGVALTNGVTHDAGDFAVSAAAGVNQLDAHGAGLAGGGFVVVWVTGGNVQARVFGSDGTPVTSDVALTSYAGAAVDGPHVAATSEGFVVAWRASGAPFAQKPVFVQRFSPAATSLSTPIPVADHTVDVLMPPTASIAVPSVTVRKSDGAIAVSWASCGDAGDGDGCGVFFRLLRPSGQPVADAATVNTTKKDSQTEPTITTVADDGLLVAWSDASQQPADESDSAVRARVIYPTLDRHDGVLGALCGAASDAPCLEGTTCQPDAKGTAICHAACTDSCPGGGTCVNGSFCAFP